MADPIQLDPEATPAGLRERLFLHETLSPGFPQYNRDDALRVMWFIRQVLANRVAHPRVFGLRSPQTEASIITDPRQFPGFEGYPHLDSGSMANVYQCVLLANAPHDRRQAAYRQHVVDAITVATAAGIPADQRVPTAGGWKRHGTPSPGPKFQFYRSLQGNDYYTTPLS